MTLEQGRFYTYWCEMFGYDKNNINTLKMFTLTHAKTINDLERNKDKDFSRWTRKDK